MSFSDKLPEWSHYSSIGHLHRCFAILKYSAGLSLELQKKGKRILTPLRREGSISAKKEKTGINTQAFIRSATMQMKAQNAPGEQKLRAALH